MVRQTLKMMILSAVFVVLSMPASAAERYVIDSTHSSISFSIRHMVVSKVRGSFTSFEGAIEYDANDPSSSSVAVTIATESIDTANDKRDDHLRNPDFFDAESYPQITFSSSEVRRTNSGYLLKGTLDMHGVQKVLEIPFEINGPINDPWGNTRMGIESSPIVINRKDFGILWNKALDGGGVVVGEEVTVEIALEAIKSKDQAPE